MIISTAVRAGSRASALTVAGSRQVIATAMKAASRIVPGRLAREIVRRPASSQPALTTSFMVGAGAAYTLAALGPDPGLRTEVLKDQMTTPAGKPSSGSCRPRSSSIW